MIPLQLMIKLLLITSLPNVGAQLTPLLILALLIDACIIAIWYMIGVVLNNNAVKGSALGEFYQFVGTAIMVGIIVGTLVMLSSTYYSALGLTKLMSSSAISTMCTNIEQNSQLSILGKTNSLLSGPSNGNGQFTGLCAFVSSSGTTDLTNKLDYPLAATAVVIANLTNQTAANLNFSFTFDAFLGFLSKLQPSFILCFDTPPYPIGCLTPSPAHEALFDLQLAFAPYAGYSLLLNNLSIFASILNLSMESFIIQMLLITMFLYAWPFVLFGGFILRSTIFTRRLGGLLIAVAIAGLIIFPTVFAFEYLTLGNGLQIGSSSGNPNGLNTTYGFNALTPLPGVNSMPGNSIPSNYVVNFYVEPNVKGISLYYSCWPNFFGGKAYGLGGAEAADIGALLIPGVSLLSGLNYLAEFQIGSSLPSFPIPVYCPPSGAISTFFALMNAYGLIGLISFLLPLINIVVTVSSIVGLSEIFGGDTSLAGLARIL